MSAARASGFASVKTDIDPPTRPPSVPTKGSDVVGLRSSDGPSVKRNSSFVQPRCTSPLVPALQVPAASVLSRGYPDAQVILVPGTAQVSAPSRVYRQYHAG